MSEKFNPSIIGLPEKLASQLELRLPPATHLSRKCIVYPLGSEETAKIHLRFLSYKLAALESLSGYVPPVYFNTLDDGKSIIFYENSTADKIPNAIFLANLELKREKMPLIPEFPTE